MKTINGKFLTRSVNGQVRVALETIKELDKIVNPNEYEIVAPESKFDIPSLRNIQVIRLGKGNAHVWEQTTLSNYIGKTRNLGLNIFNTHPFLHPDISYIHDTLFNAYPNLYTSGYGRAQKQYNLIMEKSATKRAKAIIAVSEFTKSEIIKYYHVNPNRIHVIYNGWQHMNDVIQDESIFTNYPQIEKNKYFMAASGVTPQKNFKWITENAKLYPNQRFVIVGAHEKSTQDEMQSQKNVLYVGRVSDGQMKSLMQYCRAFIHPAIYEGFGMTPLEAVGSGCHKVIVAKASCLPEIYGDYAYYIDPKNPKVNLDQLISEKEIIADPILAKYSWAKAAQQLKQVIDSLE